MFKFLRLAAVGQLGSGDTILPSVIDYVLKLASGVGVTIGLGADF